ncbi:MAG: rod shape-determining protein MreD [Rhodobacteraceae bacterium]|nr:rod shape-determining protein MreD [Paracoccaceae bacterium]
MRRRRSPALLRQGAFLLVCAAAIYLPLAPLAPGSERVAPDVLFCVVIAWVLRDPASAPAWIIIAAGLVADLVLARPVGLGALGLLAASELARAQRDRIHGINILVEWIAVLLLFVLTWAATLFVLRLSFADTPGLDISLRLVTETAMMYPLISLVAALGMRIFGPARGVARALEQGGTW